MRFVAATAVSLRLRKYQFASQGKHMWSIGIYAGSSPFDLRSPALVDNPVLTCESVSDVVAKFVADPFMVRRAGCWYMFFEVMNSQTSKGEIGLATSVDGLAWSYQQIVLSEPFHLSYPYVFEWHDEYYMVPETLQAEAVCLFKAEDFPTRWSQVSRQFEGSYGDPSIFQYGGRWWILACSTPYQHDTLCLFYADHLLGPWREHPGSPIVQGNKHSARPGGRVLVLPDRVVRFAQDCVPTYGSQLRAFEVSRLTANSYVEKEIQNSPILKASGSGWNALGMHHIDPHLLPGGQWIACVDGLANQTEQSASRTLNTGAVVNG